MLVKVEVRTLQGDLLTLPISDVETGYLIQEITGLDPVKATLVSSSFAGLDGEQYQSSRRETRNITMQMGLIPDPAVENVRDLRKKLYNFFMPKTEVYLRFYMADGLDVDIAGRVESLESAMFTDKPAVNISIIAFDPDFFDPVPVDISGTTTSSALEFPVEYDGTVDTGIILTLDVDRTLTEFTLYHRTPNSEIRTMDFSAPLAAGDILTISTVPGSKGAKLNRAGTESSVLYGVSPQSNWTELMYGTNYLRVYAEGAGIPFTIEYVTKYGGL